MHPFFQHPVVRRCRIIFRWCRIFFWLVLLLVVAAISYLHLIGLPDFIKKPMLRRLRAEGVEAQFSSMQLAWGLGPSVVIENAAFSRARQPLSPRLAAGQAELALDWKALLHAQIEMRSLQVAGAQLQLPVSETNGDMLLLTNVALNMQFFSNDVVRLNFCRGVFRGIHLDIIGKVTHASAMRRWNFPGGGNTNEIFQTCLRQVAQTVNKIHFAGTPVLQIEAGADGRDKNSFHAELNFNADSADTPWGEASDLSFSAACARLADSGQKTFLQVQARASSMATRWAGGRKVLFLSTFSHDANSNIAAVLRFDAARFNAPLDSRGSSHLDAVQFSWNGSATLASSNFVPLLVTGKLRASEPKTPWGSAQEVSLEGRAIPVPNPPPVQAGWGPWARIAPWTLDGEADLRNVASPKLRLDHLAFAGHWRAPQVVIENLQAGLYNGHLSGGASLDVVSRELHCAGATDFNPHSVSQLFNPSASNWLAQLDWTIPPKVNARLRLVLPPWTSRTANSSAETASSLQLAGDFTVGASSFRGVETRSAAAHVTYANRTWYVSRLHAVRPDGDIDLDYTSGPHEYHYMIDSRLDPKSVLTFVAPGRTHLLDDFSFRQAPAIHAEIWGRWPDATVAGVTATVLAENFAARGETVGAFLAGVEYTNQILTVHNLTLSNSQCQVQAPWLQCDLDTKMVIVTNAAGVVDPPVLQRVLRRNSPDFLNVVHFDAPPAVSVSGSFSLTNAQAADLHFLVSGRGLHFTNLLADRITGEVDWAGRTVALTNISASLYKKGTLTGSLVFVTKPEDGTDFHANFTVKNIDLSSMVTGLSGKTNRLEGRLDGFLDVTGPNQSDRSDLQGRGRIHVHDALLWDIKMFGLLSPVLNLFSPGWGYSRAREAMADFRITNGAITSDDLEMRCTGFVLKLHGTIDRDKKINARLEAVLSREVPLLGPLLSLAFTPFSKLFEYHIYGPWTDPALEPVYVPRFISYLLHPFKSMKGPAASAPPPAATPATPQPDNSK